MDPLVAAVWFGLGWFDFVRLGLVWVGLLRGMHTQEFGWV
jgi:hypothetical protein